MAITSFAPSPAQKQQKLDLQRTKNLQKQGWGEFGEQQSEQTQAENDQKTFDNWNIFLTAPKPEDIKIEIPLTVQAKPQEAVQLIEKQVDYEQKRIDYDIGEVLEAEQVIANSQEFPLNGSLSFNAEASAVAEAEKVISENQKIRQSEESVTLRNEEPNHSQEIEPQIEDSHTLQPQEFKHNDVDLVRHHPDFDPIYFFGWIGEQTEPVTKPLTQFLNKTILNVKQWVETKTALIDDLLFKQIFGLGQKKEVSKEEKETQQKQAANKRMFFDNLRAGASKVVGAERKRSLKSRLEALNKTLKRGNLSYEGDLDESGQIRESTLIEEERANSQKSEQQLKEEKRRKLMMASKQVGKKGPGITISSDKAHNFNNAAKLAG